MGHTTLYSPGSPGAGAMLMLNPGNYQMVVGFSGGVESRLPGVLCSYSKEVASFVVDLARFMGSKGVKPRIYFIAKADKVTVVTYFCFVCSWEEARDLTPEETRQVMDSHARPEEKVLVVHIAEVDIPYDWFSVFYDLYRKLGIILLQLNCLDKKDVLLWQTKIETVGWKLPELNELLEGLKAT